MTYARPDMLTAAAVAVPLLLFLVTGAVRRWRDVVASWGPAAGPAKAVRVRTYAASWSLRGLAVILAFVALAGPQLGEKTVEVQRRGVDLLLALDVSRSMLAADPAPSRLEWAKRETRDLLDKLPGARIGLVAFAGTAFLQCPFTVDRETLRLYLDHVSTDYLPVGGTSLGEAVTAAADSFDPSSPADRAIILVSDGEATSPGVEEAAARVREKGIRIFALGLGSGEGAPVPARGGGFTKDENGRIVVSRLEEGALSLLARETGGMYTRARSDGDDTAALVSRIRQTMKETELEGGTRTIPEDRYQWVLAPAVVLWLAGAALYRRRMDRMRGAEILGIVVLVLLMGGGEARAERSFAAAVREAQKAYDSGDFAAASRGFGEAAAARPDDPRPLYNEAVSRYEDGAFKEAAEGFQRLGASDADSALKERAWYNLGNARYRSGDLKGAVAAYEEALGIDADDEDAKRNLAFVKKRLEEMQQQKQDKDGQEGDDQKDDKAGKEGSGEKDGKDGGDRQNNRQQAGQQQGSPDSGSERQSAGSGGQDQQQRGDEGAGSEKQPSEQRQAGDSSGEQPQESSGEQDAADAGGEEQRMGASGSEERAREREAAERIFGGEAGRRRAEALLERLQDRPGTALIPRYEKREVKKDW